MLTWWFPASALVNGIASSLFGIVAYVKNPYVRKNRIYALYCAALSLWSFSYFFWQLSNTAEWALFFCRALMMGAILIPVVHYHHLLALFDRKISNLLIAGYALSAIYITVNCTSHFVTGVRPILMFKFWPTPGLLYVPYLAGFGFFLGASIFMIYQECRKALPSQKNLLVLISLATLIGYGGGATNFPLWYGIHVIPLGNVFVTVYTSTVFYILTQHHLMDITIIIRKTLVYSAVMSILAVCDMLIMTFLTRLFGVHYNTVFSSAVAAGSIALFFQPLRKRVQAFVDRKFFRQYVDREEKLYELSREVVTHTSPVDMANSLVRVLGDTLHPKTVSLYLKSQDGNNFVQISATGGVDLPGWMPVDNPLPLYFMDHPQPFIQEAPAGTGESMETRSLPSRRAA